MMMMKVEHKQLTDNLKMTCYRGRVCFKLINQNFKIRNRETKDQQLSTQVEGGPSSGGQLPSSLSVSSTTTSSEESEKRDLK